MEASRDRVLKAINHVQPEMETVYIPAITYHQVLSEDMPVLARGPGEGVLSGQIYLADFVRHMDFLSEQGFTTIKTHPFGLYIRNLVYK